MRKNAADQRAALQEHEKASQKALEDQRNMFTQEAEKRDKAAKEEMESMKVNLSRL